MNLHEKINREAELDRIRETVPEIVHLRYGDQTRIAGFSFLPDQDSVRVQLILPGDHPLSLLIANPLIEQVRARTSKGLSFLEELRHQTENQAIKAREQAAAAERRRALIQDEYGDGYDSLFEDRG
jgi:hypothetical protein